MRCQGMGGRIVPPEGNGTGYISWHRDKPPADSWPLPNYRMIKCFLNVYGTSPNGGETAVVPGSFRLEAGPAQVLDRRHNIRRFSTGSLHSPSSPLRLVLEITMIFQN